MDRSTKRARRVRHLVCVAAAASVAVPWGLAAGAAEPSQQAWWNRASQDLSTPVGPLPPTPAPEVPDEGLPVTATAGEQSRVSAVGIPIDGAPGATVDAAVLTLEELPEASVAAEDAEVVACPILEFWVEGPNQHLDAVPEMDCDQAVEGARDDDGTWTFDLAPIAVAWLDLDSGINPDGMALVPAEETTGSFQVVFDGSTAEVDLRTSGGDDIGDPFAIPPAGDPGDLGGTGDDPGSDPGFEAGSPSFDSGGFTSPDVGSGAPDLDDLETAAPDPGDDDADADDAADDEVAAPVASRRPMGLGELPGPVWLLAPLVLGLAAVTSYSLGPAGEPVAAAGGRTVTRALSTRTRLEAPR